MTYDEFLDLGEQIGFTRAMDILVEEEQKEHERNN